LRVKVKQQDPTGQGSSYGEVNGKRGFASATFLADQSDGDYAGLD